MKVTIIQGPCGSGKTRLLRKLVYGKSGVTFESSDPENRWVAHRNGSMVVFEDVHTKHQLEVVEHKLKQINAGVVEQLYSTPVPCEKVESAIIVLEAALDFRDVGSIGTVQGVTLEFFMLSLLPRLDVPDATNLVDLFNSEPRFGDSGVYETPNQVLEQYDVIRGIQYWPHRVVCMAALRFEMMPRFPDDVDWDEGLADHLKQTSQILSRLDGRAYTRFMTHLTLYKTQVQVDSPLALVKE